ncbi:MAG: carbamate kinase [Lachnospiraceae bacterium]|nr:carbamate kinase [Lachnospiraceae bacterium]
METVVIALGGNALTIGGKLADAPTQLRIIDNTANEVADIIGQGYKVVMTHGNGPQVGGIVVQNEASSQIVPAMPFDVCGAMSQGMLGYHMIQGLQRAGRLKNIAISPVAVVTQVRVDPEDPKFKNPSKPIGAFFTEEEAKQLTEEKGYTMKEDAGRGWRRVVASPLPLEIIELKPIRDLIEAGHTVIAVGGGGVPVYRDHDGDLVGTAAVIDKDLASERLAQDLDADIFMMLTAVEKCYINFNKPDQKALDRLTPAEAREYIAQGQFAAGSMLPKVEAAIRFVEGRPGRKCIITTPEKSVAALAGQAGTIIEA